MKKGRILFLILATILLVGTVTSCATNAAEITISLKIVANEDVILDTDVKLNDADPTVLMAFQEGCITSEIDYELDSSSSSVKRITTYDDIEKDGQIYFWTYTINGVEPDANTAGKANAQGIKDKDQIVYTYTSIKGAETAGTDETTVAQ